MIPTLELGLASLVVLSLAVVLASASWRLSRQDHTSGGRTHAHEPASSTIETVPAAVIPWWVEGLVLAAVAPGLWFPTVRPALAALSVTALALYWLAAGLLEGRPWPRSAYSAALSVLLLAFWVGSLQSPSLALTLPKITSLLLGIGVFRFCLVHGSRPNSRWPVLVILLGIGLLFSTVGLVNGLRYSKISAVGDLLALLPRSLLWLPESQKGRASLNQLGGALLVIVPLLYSVSLLPPSRRFRALRIPPLRRMLAGAGAMVLGSAIGLTQSRSAWLGLLAGLLVFLVLGWRWGRWVAIALVIMSALAWLVWRDDQVTHQLLVDVVSGSGPRTALGSLSLKGRLGIWAHTLECIRSHPLFGCGVGTFRLWDATPSAVQTVYDTGTPHAHNVFLQVAYDAGLVGLLAYLALVIVAMRYAWAGYRGATGLAYAVAVGGLVALISYHVYGLTDVVALGAKPGVLFWGLLGMIAASQRMADGTHSENEEGP